MEPIYITGHRNPDTDSIVAAISYAMLKNALGDRAYVAARIGELSDQTEMLLNKFGLAGRRRIGVDAARHAAPQVGLPM